MNETLVECMTCSCPANKISVDLCSSDGVKMSLLAACLINPPLSWPVSFGRGSCLGQFAAVLYSLHFVKWIESYSEECSKQNVDLLSNQAFSYFIHDQARAGLKWLWYDNLLCMNALEYLSKFNWKAEVQSASVALPKPEFSWTHILYTNIYTCDSFLCAYDLDI